MFPKLSEGSIDCVDCFAGKRSVSLAFKNKGYKAVSHDIEFTEDDDTCLQMHFFMQCMT